MTARIFRPANLPPGMTEVIASTEENIDRAADHEVYTVATLPDAGPPFRWIHVSDEAGGPASAINNGTDWLRFPDGAVVS